MRDLVFLSTLGIGVSVSLGGLVGNVFTFTFEVTFIVMLAVSGREALVVALRPGWATAVVVLAKGADVKVAKLLAEAVAATAARTALYRCIFGGGEVKMTLDQYYWLRSGR